MMRALTWVRSGALDSVARRRERVATRKLDIVGLAFDVFHASLAATIGLFPWWPLLLGHGKYIASLVAMQRYGGDTQYFPIIGGLAHLTFGDNQVFEQYRSGIRSFPFAAAFPHALCFGLFGVHGWMVADMLVPVAYFWMVRWIFRELGFERRWASLFSVAMVFASFMDALDFLRTPSVTPMMLPGAFGQFTFRLVRPYVTEVFTMFALAALLRLAFPDPSRPARGARWDAIVAGIAVASLAQADIYATTAILPVLVLVAGTRLVWELSDSAHRKEALARGLLFAGATALFALPFLLQRIGEHPDLPRRLGLMKVPRDQAPLTADEIGNIELALFSAAALLVPFLGRGWGAALAMRGHLLRLACLFLVAAGSAFSRKLFVTVTGSEIQNYHFPWQFQRSYGIAVSALVCFLVYHALRRLGSGTFARWTPRFSRYAERALCAIGSVGVVLMAVHNAKAAAKNDAIATHHARSDYFFYGELGDAYLPDLRELVAELDRRKGPNFRVLATLDHELASWWVTFRQGLLLNPDPFSSTLSDVELEKRLVAFGSIMGMDAPQFIQFVTQGDDSTKNQHLGQNNIVTVFFHSHDKYATRGNTWHLTIPPEDLKKLEDLYRDNASSLRYRVDGIVLFARGSLADLKPDAKRFEKVFENGTFRLYVPRSEGSH